MRKIITMFIAVFLLLVAAPHRFVVQAEEVGRQEEPTGINISKTAEPVEGMLNTWEINLEIEVDAPKEKPKSEVFIVFDLSGSMGIKVPGTNTTRLQFAQEAAINLVNEVMTKDSNVSVSFATFSSNSSYNGKIYTHSGDNNIDHLITEIGKLKPGGYTNTQSGIRAINDFVSKSESNRKSVIFMTDGEPTMSYYHSNNKDNLFEGKTKLNEVHGEPYVVYNYNITTDDSSSRSRYDMYNSASNEAFAIRTKINNGEGKYSDLEIYSVATDIADTASEKVKDLMTSIASSPKNVFMGSSDELEKIYDNIIGKISAPIILDEVIDPMGTGFKVIDGSIVQSSGDQVSITQDGLNITWDNIGLKLGLNGKYYAQLKYRVETTVAIVQEMNRELNLPTNGKTILNYKDENSIDRSLDFEVPRVEPIILNLQKHFVNRKGDDILNNQNSFKIQIENESKTYAETLM